MFDGYTQMLIQNVMFLVILRNIAEKHLHENVTATKCLTQGKFVSKSTYTQWTPIVFKAKGP